MTTMSRLCLNWKILAGLAVVGLGVVVVAPNLVWVTLPLLLAAACPLSMLLMMRGMQGGQGQCASQPGQGSRPTGVEPTRDEHLAELKVQLADLQSQHEAIAREIAQLEVPGAPAVRGPAGSVSICLRRPTTLWYGSGLGAESVPP
jgi:Protein of unknown function (DUF2933)